MMELNVHTLPMRVGAEELTGGVTIVIDQLRASSTICQALAAGAVCVRPYVEIEEARAATITYDSDEILLGGERHGRLIEGFNLGNSPLEYTPDVVNGRQVFFTTTNGTRAMHHARMARRTLIGSAMNRQAVAEAVYEESQVDILCAGTGGVETGEDILAAGAIVEELLSRSENSSLNEAAIAARSAWQQLLRQAEYSHRTPSEQLAISMRDTTGGRNLQSIGHDYDLAACAQLDSLDVVPELNQVTGEIRPA